MVAGSNPVSPTSTDDGDTALAIESEVQGGALSIGKPFLNPR